MSVGANVKVAISNGVTLTDSGTLTFNSGDAVSFSYTPTTPIVVTNGGVLNVSSAAFTGYSTSYTTQIYVNGGGHFTASGSTFTFTQVYLDNGSILNAGDLVGNSFNSPIYLPATSVQYLSGAGSNNAQFQDVNILAGESIGSGQSLTLNAIGTASTAKLRYVFPGNFTVAGTMNVGAGVSVLIQPGVTLTDNGTLTFGNGDTVTFAYSYGATTQIQVGNGGLLTASTTTFTAPDTVDDLVQIYVNSGGHLQANNSTFALSRVYLDNGNILNATDLSGNSFNDPLFLPAADVQYLSGSGSDNAQFQDIDILPGSVPSGQTLALNAIGTASTAKLRYVFPGNFTVAGTMNVGAGVSVLIQPGVTLTDNGTLTFGNGDTVTFAYSYGATTQIQVGNGGLLTASTTTFTAPDTVDDLVQIYVNGGGHFTASNSSFTFIQVYLDNGSILNATDLSGNSFNSPLFLPEGDVQYLSGSGSNNAQFQNIDILAGSVPGGQTLALNAIGAASTANLVYVFPGNFTVAGTMNIAAGISVLIQPGVTLTDDGSLTFGSGDLVTFAYSYGATTQIVVGSGGVLSASGVTFTNSSPSNNIAQIVVSSGGQLTAGSSNFALTSLTLNSGSADTIQLSTFSSQLAINSGASISIFSNEFSNIPANGVIASGNSSSPIGLSNNSWGTTNATQIPGQDHWTTPQIHARACRRCCSRRPLLHGRHKPSRRPRAPPMTSLRRM